MMPEAAEEEKREALSHFLKMATKDALLVAQRALTRDIPGAQVLSTNWGDVESLPPKD
jgi:dsDNA-binding SOS-regulon protein